MNEYKNHVLAIEQINNIKNYIDVGMDDILF